MVLQIGKMKVNRSYHRTEIIRKPPFPHGLHHKIATPYMDIKYRGNLLPPAFHFHPEITPLFHLQFVISEYKHIGSRLHKFLVEMKNPIARNGQQGAVSHEKYGHHRKRSDKIEKKVFQVFQTNGRAKINKFQFTDFLRYGRPCQGFRIQGIPLIMQLQHIDQFILHSRHITGNDSVQFAVVQNAYQTYKLCSRKENIPHGQEPEKKERRKKEYLPPYLRHEKIVFQQIDCHKKQYEQRSDDQPASDELIEQVLSSESIEFFFKYVEIGIQLYNNNL